MKQLIEFDKESYTNEINKLNNLVTGINKAIEIIVQFEPITFDEIKKLCLKDDYITKERYQKKLKELAQLFSIRYESLNDNENSHIRQMANSSIQFLRDAKKLIGNVSFSDKHFFTDNLIIFDESTVKIAPNAEELIRAKHTHYTKNKAEAVLLEKVASITNSLNEIEAEFGQYKSNNLYFYHLGEKRYKINKNVLVAFANQNR